MTADLLAPLLARPWAISSRHFLALQSHLRAILGRTEPAAFFDLADCVTPRPAMSIDDQGAATIHVQGALADKAPPIWQKLGQTDYRAIRTELAAASAAHATSLTLLIDSPGGTLAGLEETATAIQALGNTIPVHAHCDGMACSAAYWLASSADTISAAPSADIGNIGVVLSFYDDSAFLQAEGFEHHLLTNQGADLKGTFREPPTEAQLAFLQETLDDHGAAFHAHVTGNRPGIDPEVFRAGWYSGQAALDLGLIDTLTQ